MWGQQGAQKVAQAVGSCNSAADARRGDTLTVKHVSILTPRHNQALPLCVCEKQHLSQRCTSSKVTINLC